MGAGRAAKRTAALAGCLSLGAQSCASARSVGHANSRPACGIRASVTTIPILRAGSIPWDARVLKVGSRGNLDAYGARWKIAKALRGEWVQLEQVEQRVLVYYCRTLIRELDLKSRCSTAVDRSSEHRSRVKTVKDVPGQTVKHVMGLNRNRRKERGTRNLNFPSGPVPRQYYSDRRAAALSSRSDAESRCECK